MSAEAMISHSVFFTLDDNSDAARDGLVGDCKVYLSDHPGTVFFSAGTLATQYDRPVNDREFDVALHVVFESEDAHNAYQQAAKHQEFVEKNKANWKQVRVFDAQVER